MSNYRISYAQNREDIILAAFFEDITKGFYVDVGANHPDTLSVTKIFYDNGWNGINLEPNKDLYNLIIKARPRDINLNIGAADKKGELTPRQYPDGDGLSTFSKATQKDYQKTTSTYKQYTNNYKDYKVAVKPLKDIFRENKVNIINFMNIDVEGFEYQVIAGNDWDKYRPQVLCIEANHIAEDWRPLLKKANYDLVFFDGLNNYYVAHEHPEIVENFSYVNSVLLGKPIIAAHLKHIIDNLELRQLNYENRATRHDLVEEGLRAEIHNLYLQQIANKRLRALIKQIIVSINAIILIHIEKLNHPKLNNSTHISFKGVSKSDLLESIKEYDMDRYYNSKIAHPLTYKLLHNTYVTFYTTAKKLTRKLVRVVKGGRK